MVNDLYNPEAANDPKPKAKRGPKPKAQTAQHGHAAVHTSSAANAPTADAKIAPELQERQLLKADIERIRKIRKPFGSMTQKLALPGINGYHQHWFNDDPGRVEEATANGWAHVMGKDGKPVKRVVGRGRDSAALYAYAMKLPIIFWQEDLNARHDAAQARIDEVRKKPFRAKPGQAEKSDAGKFYSPNEDGEVVHMKTTRARIPNPGEEAA